MAPVRMPPEIPGNRGPGFLPMHRRENTSNGINNQDIGSLIGFTDTGAMHKPGDPAHQPAIDHIPRFPVFPGKEGMHVKNKPE